jgi:hypothetical protein
VLVGPGVQLLSASRPELIPVFTGLSERQFGALVKIVARRGGDAVADGRPGRQWCLPLTERVLLVAVYYRTNLTMRQIAPLFSDHRLGGLPDHRPPRPAPGAGPGQDQARRRDGVDRGRHPGPDPRPHRGRAE